MEAPGQRLTFLFADVEGSTRITEQHGADAGVALARYHELVATTSERHDGRIFERIGDGAYATFPDAMRAVSAADEIQQRIGAEDWGAIGRLRVRVALASGDVEQRDERFFGVALVRAARLEGLASGGETLLAGSTVD
ncbi:MAG: adenylate/guanylate cyclase domain-containing protein, partial [Candidatus Limnocylindria bacterium]